MLWLAAVLLAAPADTLPREPSVPPPRLSAAQWLEIDRAATDELDLVPMPGGGFRYEDEKAGFVATINPDGTVDFESYRPVTFHTSYGPTKGWFDGLVAALMKPAGQRDRPDLEYPMPPRDDMRARAAALVRFTPPSPYGDVACFNLGFRFGGVQARSASKKAKMDFMKRTEALRDTMTIRWREGQREDAIRRVSEQVVEIWKNEALSLADRKRQVFELWDDADPTLDGKLDEAAVRMRARIERAVRLLAPAGSSDAFSPADLARLNAVRVSPAKFDPYRPATAELSLSTCEDC